MTVIMIIVGIINSSHVINRTSFHTASGSKLLNSEAVFWCFMFFLFESLKVFDGF